MPSAGRRDPTALIVTDMVNTYEHEDAHLLLPSVRETLPGMTRLIERARRGGTEVINVNDNFGRWRSHHDELLAAALRGPHGDLVEPIRPDERRHPHADAPGLPF
ncbi:hypothetical protein GCM10010400_08310 [Streptomyces aculeolatus]